MWVKTTDGRLVNLDNATDIYTRNEGGDVWVVADMNCGIGDDGYYYQPHVNLCETSDKQAANDALDDIETGILTGAVLVDLGKRETFNAEAPKAGK